MYYQRISFGLVEWTCICPGFWAAFLGSGHGIGGSAAPAALGWCVLSDVFFLLCFAISLDSYDIATPRSPKTM